jgi:hypothetical protein
MGRAIARTAIVRDTVDHAGFASHLDVRPSALPTAARRGATTAAAWRELLEMVKAS